MEGLPMKEFKSTDTLMELLESGDYKRPVMKNEEDAFDPVETFEVVLQNFKNRTSRPGNYDYFTRRQNIEGGNGK
jgi:hypothetical protein